LPRYLESGMQHSQHSVYLKLISLVNTYCLVSKYVQAYAAQKVAKWSFIAKQYSSVCLERVLEGGLKSVLLIDCVERREMARFNCFGRH